MNGAEWEPLVWVALFFGCPILYGIIGLVVCAGLYFGIRFVVKGLRGDYDERE